MLLQHLGVIRWELGQDLTKRLQEQKNKTANNTMSLLC